ncbi:S1 family peptidase [Aeromonas veronii]|uniref:S1 family peptidase n=1 Tax=Aeromonas veronii TaxID=654 RepID=UPI003B9FDCA4
MTDVLLKKPIIDGGINPGSHATVCIDLYCKNSDGEDKRIGCGSGFFHVRNGMTFLITNWHVLTGRDPTNPQNTIDGYQGSPSGFSFHHSRKSNKNHFIPSPIFNLYSDGKPNWFEVDADKIYDIAAIKIDIPTDSDVYIEPIEKFTDSIGDKNIYVGGDVVIVGYPFGINASNPFPVWKHAYIASEPSILIDGVPKMFIDSPGLPGMSGSPIYKISKGVSLPGETVDAIKNFTDFRKIDIGQIQNAPETSVLSFVGIYSGSLGNGSLEKMRLGFAWHAALVDIMFTKPRNGTNPYPPIYGIE